jgi:hypothetical protein
MQRRHVRIENGMRSAGHHPKRKLGNGPCTAYIRWRDGTGSRSNGKCVWERLERVVMMSTYPFDRAHGAVPTLELFAFGVVVALGLGTGVEFEIASPAMLGLVCTRKALVARSRADGNRGLRHCNGVTRTGNALDALDSDCPICLQETTMLLTA